MLSPLQKQPVVDGLLVTEAIHLRRAETIGKAFDELQTATIAKVAFVNIILFVFDAVFFDQRRRPPFQQWATYGVLLRVVLRHDFR